MVGTERSRDSIVVRGECFRGSFGILHFSAVRLRFQGFCDTREFWHQIDPVFYLKYITSERSVWWELFTTPFGNFSFKSSSLPSFLSNRSTWSGQVASWHTISPSRGNWRSLLLTDALPLATWMAWRSRRLWIFSLEGVPTVVAFRVQAPVPGEAGTPSCLPSIWGRVVCVVTRVKGKWTVIFVCLFVQIIFYI